MPGRVRTRGRKIHAGASAGLAVAFGGLLGVRSWWHVDAFAFWPVVPSVHEPKVYKDDPLGSMVTSVYGGFQKFFVFPLLHLRCSHFGNLVYFFIWPRTWRSRVRCLGVVCGARRIGFFGTFCGCSGAVLGSTVIG